MFDVIPINGQTWLICGGRDFTDGVMFMEAMGDLVRMRGIPQRIIHGGARGTDALAGHWADQKAIQVSCFPADWERHGRAAGPIRNQQMLDEGKPDFVVAFPGSKGTSDMIRRAREAGIGVAEIKQANGEHPDER